MKLPPPGPPNELVRDMDLRIVRGWMAIGIVGLIASVIIAVVYIC